MKKLALLFTLFILITNGSLAASLPSFTLKKIDGSLFSISEHLGKKTIIIDFWATWCKPCKKLLKELDDLRKEFGDKVLVIAISTDDSSSFSRIESFIKSRRYGFTVLLDPDSDVSARFNPAGTVPYTMLINRNGDIVFTHSGYIPGFESELREKIIETFTE